MKELITIRLGKVLTPEVNKRYQEELKKDKLLKESSFLKRLIIKGLKK